MPVAAADLLIMVVHLVLAELAAAAQERPSQMQQEQEQQTSEAVAVEHNQSLVDQVDQV